jgi:hypothetical protein
VVYSLMLLHILLLLMHVARYILLVIAHSYSLLLMLHFTQSFTARGTLSYTAKDVCVLRFTWQLELEKLLLSIHI